ncbi:disulfide bond formation protein B [Acidithiobacillus ferrivorans]|nr:disulfide bond formation protein B [Acidithiobacillus ferrivorans]
MHWFNRHAGKGIASAFSLAGSAGIATVSACAGGVCTVGAQAGASLLAATASTGLTAFSAGSGMTVQGGYPWWPVADPSIVTLHQPLPWWMKIAVVALLLSTGYTALALASTRRYAWLAILGGIGAAVAELRWFPGGAPVEYATLAFGLSSLLLAPWLPRLRYRPWLKVTLGTLILVTAFSALLMAGWMQVALGWTPCALCILQRIDLGILLLLVATRHGRSMWAGVMLLLGEMANIEQMVEMSHTGAVASNLASACAQVGPSCALAGARQFLGWPVAWETAALFTGLWIAWLLYTTQGKPSCD